jgi:hypothetical protein
MVAAAGAFALSYGFSRIVDQSLADAAGLRTLRKGTDPIHWASSHLMGYQPPVIVGNTADEYGIDFTKIIKVINDYSSQQIQTLAPGRIQTIALTLQAYILRNRIMNLLQQQVKDASPFMHGFFFGSNPLMWIFRKCVMHSISYLVKASATYKLIKGPNDSGNVRCASMIGLSLIAALFIPTIKLRYRDEEAKEKFSDPLSGNVVLYTDKTVSPLHIGLLGTLTNGIGLRFPLWTHPIKVLRGAGKLALAGVVAYGAFALCPRFIQAHKTALIAGAFFAFI